jgi:hypothetical protein
MFGISDGIASREVYLVFLEGKNLKSHAFCTFSATARSAKPRVSSQIFTRLARGVLLNS